MNIKILTLISKDADTGKPLMSMDSNSEDYWGDIPIETINQLVEASNEVRTGLLQKEIRSLSEDPDFLSLWGYLGKRESSHFATETPLK